MIFYRTGCIKNEVKKKFLVIFIAAAVFGIRGFYFTNNVKTVQAASTAFYVDPTAGGGGNGSYSSPWNSLTQVNAHSFSTGDDVYFKAGTTLNVPAGQYLDIDWNGTSGDWVIIGSYYGNGLFGLNGGARPILDSNYTSPPSEIGAIQRIGSGYPTRTSVYVEIKDIRVDRPLGYGILAMDIDYFKITNCYIYHGYYSGSITVVRSQEVTIDGNTIDRCAYGGANTGSCLQVGQDGQNNTIISNNIVSGLGTEGIGAYHRGENYEIFGNVVFDTQNVGIYVDRAKYVNIYDNIVYTSTSSPGGHQTWLGIGVDNELQADFCFTGNVNIYDNKVANCGIGIMISSENTSCINQYVNVYNNVLADNLYNFRFWGGQSNWHDNNIYYNISYTSNNSTMAHVDSGGSPLGITWGTNIFDDDVSGNAAVEACTVAAPLVKTTGWNNLTAGSVTASTFALSSAGIAGSNSCFGSGDTISPAAPSGLMVE